MTHVTKPETHNVMEIRRRCEQTEIWFSPNSEVEGALRLVLPWNIARKLIKSKQEIGGGHFWVTRHKHLSLSTKYHGVKWLSREQSPAQMCTCLNSDSVLSPIHTLPWATMLEKQGLIFPSCHHHCRHLRHTNAEMSGIFRQKWMNSGRQNY